MTNEHIAALIGEGGNDELLPLLWEKMLRFYRMAAQKYERLHSVRCAQCGVTYEDILQESYFAMLDSIKAYNERTPEQAALRFISFCGCPFRTRASALIGMRTKAGQACFFLAYSVLASPCVLPVFPLHILTHTVDHGTIADGKFVKSHIPIEFPFYTCLLYFCRAALSPERIKCRYDRSLYCYCDIHSVVQAVLVTACNRFKMCFHRLSLVEQGCDCRRQLPRKVTDLSCALAPYPRYHHNGVAVIGIGTLMHKRDINICRTVPAKPCE